MTDLVLKLLTSSNLFPSTGKQLYHLAQSISTQQNENKKGTNRIFISFYKKIQKVQKLTYISKNCTYRPKQSEPNQTQFPTMENFNTDYTGEISTEVAGLEVIKMYLNSILLTIKAKYMAMDISNMYLNTPLG